jgi:cystathionine beta-synthase
MVTEGNLMSKLVHNKVKPSDPVSSCLYNQFKMVETTCTLGKLSRMLDRDHFVLVVSRQTCCLFFFFSPWCRCFAG